MSATMTMTTTATPEIQESHHERPSGPSGPLHDIAVKRERWKLRSILAQQVKAAAKQKKKAALKNSVVPAVVENIKGWRLLPPTVLDNADVIFRIRAVGTPHVGGSLPDKIRAIFFELLATKGFATVEARLVDRKTGQEVE